MLFNKKRRAESHRLDLHLQQLFQRTLEIYSGAAVEIGHYKFEEVFSEERKGGEKILHADVEMGVIGQWLGKGIMRGNALRFSARVQLIQKWTKIWRLAEIEHRFTLACPNGKCEIPYSVMFVKNTKFNPYEPWGPRIEVVEEHDLVRNPLEQWDPIYRVGNHLGDRQVMPREYRRPGLAA